MNRREFLAGTAALASADAVAQTASDVLVFPDSPLARDALTLVTSTEGVAIANHSIRSWLFARLLARHDGVDLDRDLLFHACVLHDLGLTTQGDRQQRFEVDGADVAAEFLTAKGLAATDVDAVWEAIALHSSTGIASAERSRPLTRYTHLGIGIDFGFPGPSDVITDAQAAEIHRAYPRHRMATTLANDIIAQARRQPGKAQPYTLAADLVRERDTAPYITGFETIANTGRWGN